MSDAVLLEARSSTSMVGHCGTSPQGSDSGLHRWRAHLRGEHRMLAADRLQQLAEVRDAGVEGARLVVAAVPARTSDAVLHLLQAGRAQERFCKLPRRVISALQCCWEGYCTARLHTIAASGRTGQPAWQTGVHPKPQLTTACLTQSKGRSRGTVGRTCKLKSTAYISSPCRCSCSSSAFCLADWFLAWPWPPAMSLMSSFSAWEQNTQTFQPTLELGSVTAAVHYHRACLPGWLRQALPLMPPVGTCPIVVPSVTAPHLAQSVERL